MPRAKLDELRGYMTTSTVAEALDLSPYLVKARISDGVLPPASRVTDAGVLLFDDEWMERAREVLAVSPRRRRRRGQRGFSRLPSPERVLGHRVGEPGWIPTWTEMHEYFEALEKASNRVTVERLGESTSGLPYIVVAISAAENLGEQARDRNRSMLEQLWDPRETPPTRAEDLINDARTVGIILASQHSNEIGAALMTLELAYDLARANDPETLAILNNTITLLVPSHNPDGIDMIAEWYARWRNTEYDGSELPWLYHPYTGHDNNRDWFMMTQEETKLYVELHNREHPQAVFDMHQMGRHGPRYMVPPFIDPLDPNQDPVIQQGFAALGSHIAQRMTSEGLAGVATHAIFDNYSPSLAYGNYHGSVDLLSEAASVKLATSITVPEEKLKEGDHGWNSIERTWNQPMPWKGGEWTLGDIVTYNKTAARAFLSHLAYNRPRWLRDYFGIAGRAVQRTEKPYGFVIPPDQRDPGVTIELIDILQRGLVEVHRATAPYEADGVTWPEGSYIVDLSQPAGAFAKTLLEAQEYPDIRQWPDGPAQRPYDIVGHSLPVQMGVTAAPLDRPLPETENLERMPAPVDHPGEVKTATTETNAWVLEQGDNASFSAINLLHQRDIPVVRLRDRNLTAELAAGAILLRDSDVTAKTLTEISDETGARFRPLTLTGEQEVMRQKPVRLGIYQPWTASMDEGWVRWILEGYDQPYTTLRTNDIRQGGLKERFDVILIPDMTPKDFREGRSDKGRYNDPYPPEYVGGLGTPGIEALQAFTYAGGTLIGIDSVVPAVIDALALPVRTPLAEVEAEEFSCPGSLLRVVNDTCHPLAYGLSRETNVLFLNSTVMEASHQDATTVSTFPVSNPNVSGWITGEKHLFGKHALVEIAYGDGRVILAGFRPYFRAQTRGSYKVLFNAITRAGLTEETVCF